MKREDLKAIEGITPEMIDKIMALHQIDAEAWKTEKENLIETQNTLNERIKAFDGVDVQKLQQDLKEWEQKYKDDLLQKDKDFAKADLFRGYKFSSKLSRKAAELEFDSKGFEFKDGKFAGAEQFFEDLKKSDPDAFQAEETSETETKKKTGVDLNNGGSAPKLSGVEAAFYAMNPDLKQK